MNTTTDMTPDIAAILSSSGGRSRTRRWAVWIVLAVVLAGGALWWTRARTAARAAASAPQYLTETATRVRKANTGSIKTVIKPIATTQAANQAMAFGNGSQRICSSASC